MPKKKNNKLNEELKDSEKLYVEAYLCYLNKKKAAISAGYKPDFAAQQGNELYNKLYKKHIKPRLDLQLKEYQVFSGRILQEEMSIAYSNIKNIKNLFSGEMRRKIEAIPDEFAIAISGFEINEKPNGEVQTKFKFWDKGKSLNRLGNYLDMYNKENVVIEEKAPTMEERMKDIDEILSKFDIKKEMRENGWSEEEDIYDEVVE